MKGYKDINQFDLQDCELFLKQNPNSSLCAEVRIRMQALHNKIKEEEQQILIDQRNEKKEKNRKLLKSILIGIAICIVYFLLFYFFTPYIIIWNSNSNFLNSDFLIYLPIIIGPCAVLLFFIAYFRKYSSIRKNIRLRDYGNTQLSRVQKRALNDEAYSRIPMMHEVWLYLSCAFFATSFSLSAINENKYGYRPVVWGYTIIHRGDIDVPYKCHSRFGKEKFEYPLWISENGRVTREYDVYTVWDGDHYGRHQEHIVVVNKIHDSTIYLKQRNPKEFKSERTCVDYYSLFFIEYDEYGDQVRTIHDHFSYIYLGDSDMKIGNGTDRYFSYDYGSSDSGDAIGEAKIKSILEENGLYLDRHIY